MYVLYIPTLCLHTIQYIAHIGKRATQELLNYPAPTSFK